MNVNLDKNILKNYKHGRLIDQLYYFDIRWVAPESINIPYDLNKEEVAQAKGAITDNRRVDPIVVLAEMGPVAGLHNLKAYQELKYDRIPILFGKLK
jgi:hypothetical protein